MRTLFIALAAVLSFGSACSGSPDDLGIDELKTLAQQGDNGARHRLCYRFIYGEGVATDYSEAKHWCELAAASGLADSQTLLAEIYFHGQGVPVDYKKALDLYEAAARQSHRHAQFMVALMYGRGQGVPKDEKRAEEWLRQSAASGYEPAKDLLQDLEASRDKARAQ